MTARKSICLKAPVGARVCCRLPSFCLALLLALTACNKAEPPQPQPVATQSRPAEAAKQPQRQQLQPSSPTLVPATLTQKANATPLIKQLETIEKASLRNIKALQKHVKRLLRSPNTKRLRRAQISWAKARASYEPLYFYTLLYSAAKTHRADALNWHQLLGAWPIQPGVLDRFGDYKFSGLTFNIGAPLTRQSLLAMHQITQTDEVVVGLYAIEYLLFADNQARTYGEFNRRKELGDVEKNAGFNQPKELPTERRRRIIQLQTQLLVSTMKAASHFWRSEQALKILASLNEQDITNVCVAFIAEHLTELTDMATKPPWRQQNSLQRMHAQLAGWAMLLPTMSWLDVKTLQPMLENELNTIRQFISALETGKPQQPISLYQRKNLYQALRQIAKVVQPGAPAFPQASMPLTP